MILAQTTGSETRISLGLVKPTEWEIEQLDLARLRARIIPSIGSKLLPHRVPTLSLYLSLCLSVSSWFILPKRVYQQEAAQPIALHVAKAIVTTLKVVFTFRYVTWTPPITANPGIQSNPEAISVC